MTSSIDAYIDELKRELRGADPATIQDAVADTAAHLHDALTEGRDAAPNSDETDLLRRAIEAYGTPADTADAYREIERRTPVASAPARSHATIWSQFFSVYRDIRTWGSLLYLLLVFALGFGYLTWTILGIVFSLSFAIFIVGIPLLLAFLLSLRGIAFLEGRIIEALLGIRMPRRPLFYPKRDKTALLAQIRGLVNDPYTGRALLYASSLWVAGIAYFVIVVTGTAFAGALIAAPVLQEMFGEPVLTFIEPFWVPQPAYPLVVVAGILLLTGLLHGVRAIGRFHGRMAKRLLVGEADA